MGAFKITKNQASLAKKLARAVLGERMYNSAVGAGYTFNPAKDQYTAATSVLSDALNKKLWGIMPATAGPTAAKLSNVPSVDSAGYPSMTANGSKDGGTPPWVCHNLGSSTRGDYTAIKKRARQQGIMAEIYLVIELDNILTDLEKQTRGLAVGGWENINMQKLKTVQNQVLAGMNWTPTKGKKQGGGTLTEYVDPIVRAHAANNTLAAVVVTPAATAKACKRPGSVLARIVRLGQGEAAHLLQNFLLYQYGRAEAIVNAIYRFRNTGRLRFLNTDFVDAIQKGDYAKARNLALKQIHKASIDQTGTVFKSCPDGQMSVYYTSQNVKPGSWGATNVDGVPMRRVKPYVKVGGKTYSTGQSYEKVVCSRAIKGAGHSMSQKRRKKSSSSKKKKTGVMWKKTAKKDGKGRKIYKKVRGKGAGKLRVKSKGRFVKPAKKKSKSSTKKRKTSTRKRRYTTSRRR